MQNKLIVAMLLANSQAVKIKADRSQYQPDHFDRVVHPGAWGDWKSWHKESTNWIVCGMKTRFEGPCGDCDDTALNGVKVRYCDENDWWKQKTVEIYGGAWGDWQTNFTMCNYGAYVTSMKARFEGGQGGGDDTALNGLQLRCRHKNWTLDSEPVVDHGSWGDWNGWSSEQNAGQYFMTGARMRFENPCGGCDDTAGNGFEIETREKFVGNGYNVLTPGWKLLKMRSGIINSTVTTQITDSNSSSQEKLKESHMDASVSLSYEVSSGIQTAGVSATLSAGASQEVKNMWTKSFSRAFVEKDTYSCPSMPGKVTKLYSFDIDLVSGGQTSMSMQTSTAVCCYGDEMPKCVPGLCYNKCCNQCY